jgi:phage terminase large subunit-like protein
VSLETLRALTPLERAKRYPREVVDGKIVAGGAVVAACERALEDRESPPPGCLWHEKSAGHVLNFFAKLLRHHEGRFRGRPFDPEPWQAFVLAELFGWLRRPEGDEPSRRLRRAELERRYRLAYLEVARKNGKTSFAAGIALYLMAFDEEPVAEVYSAATKKDQARIVFDKASRMVRELPPQQRKAFRQRQARIHYGDSKLEPVASDADSLDGLNVHGAIVDELHAHKTRDVWDRMATGTGSRSQPLILGITTAGDDSNGIAGQVHQHARSVLTGALEDDAFFAYIANLDPDDAWDDPAVWSKANPNLGVSVFVRQLEEDAKRAQQSLSEQSSFRRFRLNEWIAPQAKAWLSVDAWNACAGPENWEVLRRKIEGRKVYGGLDLASTQDLTAFVLVAPPEEEGEPWLLVPTFWIPEERVAERVQRDRVPYDVWIDRGLITTTPGDAIDDRWIIRDIVEWGERVDIQAIGFDKWGAVRVASDLMDDGLELVRYNQGRELSPPTKRLEALVLRREIVHGGHDVLTWNASNVVLRTNADGDVKPDKDKSREKIDGIVAAVMALDQAERTEPASPSVYASRGIATI